MIKKCLSIECCSDPSVLDFKKKKLFKGGKTTAPNYCLDEHGTLCHIARVRNVEQKREVVSADKAKEIVQSMHQQKKKGICVPGGINTLVRSFTSVYYYRGIRPIAMEVLRCCPGTCKLSKVLNTAQPAPIANRTSSVMEEVQCDLITIVSRKGVPPPRSHSYKYILTVKDCFSKFVG